MNRILLISSHPDDAELAAGGTIKRLIEEGHQVRHIVFSDCNNPEISNEFQRSQQVLGITDYHLWNVKFREFHAERQLILTTLIQQRDKFLPHFVITHGSKDMNQDHHVVYEESFRAFKNTTLLGYNHPWNQRAALANYFVRIDKLHLETKLEALKQYASQQHRPYFNPGFIAAQALSYGTMLQCGCAEAFETLNIFY